MSRHKLVKALDLDEELDDFDGGEDDDYEEEISVEDKGNKSIFALQLVCYVATTGVPGTQMLILPYRAFTSWYTRSP